MADSFLCVYFMCDVKNEAKFHARFLCIKASRRQDIVRSSLTWGLQVRSPTLQQRTNTENWKQIFPKKESRGRRPNFLIHVYVSNLFIPTIDLPFLLREICGPILGIYKSLTNTWMYELGLRHTIPRKGVHKWDFHCCALIIHKYWVQSYAPSIWSQRGTLEGFLDF